MSLAVADFRSVPGACTYVYGSNSTDAGGRIVTEAGTNVHRGPMQGKGHGVRGSFSADAYVLVNGDDTDDAAAAQKWHIPDA